MIVTDITKLSIPCRSVSILEAEPIITALTEELGRYSNGVGLAANQIGVDARVMVAKIKGAVIAFVNPILVDAYDLREYYKEGCLSFPTRTVTTQRFNDVCVKDDLHSSGQVFMGQEAVIVQHEIDHLNGLTMFDREIKIPQSRNDLCWCGSGKKYKRCHEGVRID